MLLKTKDQTAGATIEMTPMIDMVFLLLIFFLVATSFRQIEREMQIALPIASASAPISSLLQEFVINVNSQGTIFVGGRKITAQDLSTMIEEAVAANPEQKVTVRGDRHSAYGSVVTVLDICKAGGIQEPYLDTVPGD